MVMTFEQLQEIVTRTSVTVAELTENQKKSDERLDRLELLQEKTELALQETRRIVDETQRGLQELRLSVQDLKDTVKETSQHVGGIGNTIGEIAEYVLLSGLIPKINALGHNFSVVAHRKKFKKIGGKGNLAEIDLSLENCDEVMLVEVKSDLSPSGVQNFLQRIQLLRENEKITGLKGKTIYATIAGISFSGDSRSLAAENGIYLIEVDEDYDNEKLIITQPPKGKIGKW